MTTQTLTTVGGLALATVGVLVQFVADRSLFPVVPPGAFVLVAVGVFVVLATGWWWSPLAATAVALVIAIGGLVGGQLVENLRAGGAVTVGSVLLAVGLVVAAVGGVVAAVAQRTSAGA